MKIQAPRQEYVNIEYTFPEGFVLIVDTREVNPLFKKPPKGLMLTRDKLDSGDYSVRGFENRIAFERKDVPDLFHSLGAERDRFKRELERLKEYEYKWLIVEGSEEDCLSYQPYTKLHPNVVRQSLVSIELRYNIHIQYEPNRRRCERFVLDRLIKYYRIKRNGE